MHEFRLFRERRFCPLFVTQFLGALNDNLFKNALLILIAFGQTSSLFNQDTLINLCAALFIVPYFLFSSFAGQIADKLEKSRLIVVIKFAEVVLAVMAMFGFYFNHLPLLLCALFLLGTQATFFGPLKYSILPQHLNKNDLIGGNGLIEMGTFIAILMGTILGATLLAIPKSGTFWVSVAMGAFALFGFVISLWIPKAPPISNAFKIDWSILKQTFSLVRETYHHKIIFYVIIGISWFWLYGSVFLTQTANYTKLTLGGDEQVASLFLVAFSVGIALGSSLCQWLSSNRLDMGFVFLGITGLSLFAFDMALCSNYSVQEYLLTEPLNAWNFITHGQNFRLLTDSFLMGCFGGVYIVPLYTLLQVQSHPAYRSRVIAANNIVNAIFMVAASLLAIVVLNVGFTIPELFMFTAVLNAGMGFYLIKLGKLLRPSPELTPSL